MTQHLAKRRLGNTEIEVSTLSVGGTGFGNLYDVITDEQSTEVVQKAIAAGLNYFDTAPLYGQGLSETRLGQAFQTVPRDSFFVSSKVGWRLQPLDAGEGTAHIFPESSKAKMVMDYSAQSIKDSIEGSLERLQLEHIDILLMHDPDEGMVKGPGDVLAEKHNHFEEAMQNAYPILSDMRAKGLVKAIGLGMNQWQMLAQFAEAGLFDCFLLAGRYTLLEQTPLAEFLPMCQEKGISIIIGGPYNSGILATGATANTHFNYQEPPPQILQKVKGMEAMCIRHGITLQAAALQFPLGHSAIAAVIPGMKSVEEVQQNQANMAMNIPSDFWAELKDREIIDPDSPTPA
jgi:D-threo-aldose 1-dehydrogenase